MKSLAHVWKAVDAKGQIRQGMCEATETAYIRTWLREQGLYPLMIKPRRKGLSFFITGKDAKRQWAVFTRRLAIVLEAGIPLLKALDIISFKVSAGKNNRIQWQGVREQIQRGNSMAEALKIVTPAPSLYIQSMVRAGEKTGTLATTLNEIADDLEQECLFQRKIGAALAYPLFLLGAFFCVIFALSLWVLPTYEKLFTSLGTQLPYLTLVIFTCGRHLPIASTVFLLVFLSISLFIRFFYPQSWQGIMTKFITYIPFFGRIFRLNELVQFCRILGRLLKAGVPLLECLHFVESTVRSRQIRKLIKQAAAGVCQGKTLTGALQGSAVFPSDASEMLNVAEETGNLDTMLLHLTIIFRQELDQQLVRLTHLAEPILILGLAGLIGLVAVGILLPVFDISTNLQ